MSIRKGDYEGIKVTYELINRGKLVKSTGSGSEVLDSHPGLTLYLTKSQTVC